MKYPTPVSFILTIVFILSVIQDAESTEPKQTTIPYVATRVDAVRDMLWMANVDKDDVVYDLGSGDGRIVIAAVREFGARAAVGIENDAERIRLSRKNTRDAGVEDRVTFIKADLFETDFSKATVVTAYIGHEPNIKLRAKMFATLKPGTRIVSHQFGMGEWPTDKLLAARTVAQGMWSERADPYSDNFAVPDYSGNERHFGTSDRFLMWVVPAPVAGVWRGRFESADGPCNLELVLHQRLSKVSGSFSLTNNTADTETTGTAKVDIWGEHIRIECRAKGGFFDFGLRFDGHASGNELKGRMVLSDRQDSEEIDWVGERKILDLTGVWRLPAATEKDRTELRVDRKDGQLVATLGEGDAAAPLRDFYQFGSGLYFTAFFGKNESGGITINEKTGWLIGEAIVRDGRLIGTTEFHPYRHSSKLLKQEWDAVRRTE